MAKEVRRDFSVNDRWPVVAEPFTAWVLEDKFADGRPPLEQAGVLLVDDVAPYELMKLRLLNAGHQCLAYFGHLCGFKYVHEAASDPLFAEFLLAYFESEAIPTLPPVPGIDLHEFSRTLVERFSNPGVRDTVARLCAYSSDRIPKWLLPVIRVQLAVGGPIERATAVVASWARYAEGVDEQGEPIEIVDRLAPTLTELARKGGTAFIDNRALFGDLADDERFRETYRRALSQLHDVGARRTLEALVAD
jgi:mannitol 2-dehydrogenase